MKWLDEDINITVSGFTAPSAGTYNYTVTMYCADTTSKTLFAGNCYLAQNQTSKTFYLNDLLNTARDGFDSVFDSVSVRSSVVDIFNRVYVRLTVNSVTYNNSDYIYFAYRYPNRKDYMETNIPYTSSMGNTYAINMLQKGLLPHIPYQPDYALPFFSTIQYNASKSAYKYYYDFEDGVSGTTIDLTRSGYNMLYEHPLTTLLGSTTTTNEDGTLVLKYQDKQAETESESIIGGLTQTVCTVSGDISKLSDDTEYDLGQPDTVEVWLGNFEILIARIDNLSAQSYSYDIPKIYWAAMDSPCFKIRAYRADNPEYYDGKLTITNPILFTRTGTNFRVAFDLVWDSSSVSWELNNLKICIFYPIQYVKICDMATIDVECIADYYLTWQDRYGGFQCQRFDKTPTYSEEFTYGTVMNYKNESRHSTVEVQPKWTINSGFISNTLYPYYESIFTSPYLLLWDSNQHQYYNVNIKDSSYTEKTFKNQSRKMFNLALNLELNKQQKMVY